MNIIARMVARFFGRDKLKTRISILEGELESKNNMICELHRLLKVAHIKAEKEVTSTPTNPTTTTNINHRIGEHEMSKQEINIDDGGGVLKRKKRYTVKGAETQTELGRIEITPQLTPVTLSQQQKDNDI